MIDLEPHPQGTVLPIRAQPGARRNEIRPPRDGALCVCVTQAPEKGLANKALIAVLSKGLGLRKSQLELLSGETGRHKRVLVRGIAPEALRAKIEEVVGG